MGYLDMAAAGVDVPELHIFPNGTEVRVRIKSAEETKSSKGNPQIAIVLESPDDPLADDIYHYVSIPTADQKADDPKKYAKVYRYLTEFLECFGLDPSGNIDIEKDLPGQEGFCIVSVEQDNNGRDINRIKKYQRSA